MNIRDIKSSLLRLLNQTPALVDILAPVKEGDSSQFRHDEGMETFVLVNAEGERFIISIEKIK